MFGLLSSSVNAFPLWSISKQHVERHTLHKTQRSHLEFKDKTKNTYLFFSLAFIRIIHFWCLMQMAESESRPNVHFNSTGSSI